MKMFVVIMALAVTLSAYSGISAGTAAAVEPPPVSGWMEQFSFIDPPRPAPQTSFTAGNGQMVTLGDFKGHVLLVNFWATWCSPCVRELPSLDKLQGKLADEGLLVIAVSQDRRGAEIARPFLNKLRVNRLGLFLDTGMNLGRQFGVRALPWTFLIDREGRVVGDLAGYAEWDTEEGIALIRHYLGQRQTTEPNRVNNPDRPAGPSSATIE